ncbi:polysaccharide deacetylase family protein [Rossellomorea vietnamensis]|uniref:Polysaccharide deacetylase family protein n=2 Tax=Rossellomorea TaxID=2837508 RepID=A0A5D4K887_9BACI|nr:MULTISPECIES: polysaccharide deacetylase family protein [Rossellomorea]TYR73544.1 polysaccharide deacetylase family protein [Rossellomorea vietnamensis]TYS75525.1 polysaccharide deacetylase family protein [Rossellomorea aquimaris]
MPALMINKVRTDEKVLAITFDDGPNALYTPQVLEILQKANAKATFYMIGEQMERCPKLVKRAAELGHEIGNHTYTHPKLTELSHEKCVEEITKTELLIERLTGEKPASFRPPFLDFDHVTETALQGKGYSHLIGALNLGARDWEQPGVNHILEETRSVLSNGAIILFHDGYGDRSQTLEAISRLIPQWTAEGWKLVTISELLKLAK